MGTPSQTESKQKAVKSGKAQAPATKEVSDAEISKAPVTVPYKVAKLEIAGYVPELHEVPVSIMAE